MDVHDLDAFLQNLTDAQLQHVCEAAPRIMAERSSKKAEALSAAMKEQEHATEAGCSLLQATPRSKSNFPKYKQK